ncbi:class I lanthipeptide [Chitinophaga nivalis]|uniref:Class I lanthipeptide n=1 Tax=Chitinophaga nivalis TaxID=2991709 RepID=A0ABT3IJ58_9BACT|nr:class I lanthipeptide [Chitinophaga nivalis]MCW3466331.1 class I lanthipeptide [Chitinophaga nivalis]MCW3483978.1 class I lanthipeptide [Chitinophaga nivalis]
MKKQSPSKLQLKKIRIAALQPVQPEQIRGGAPTTTVQSITCPGNEACYSGIIACESVRICNA